MGFFGSSFRIRALFQTCPQQRMQFLCSDFGTFKLCFGLGQEGIKLLELDNSLLPLGASQGFDVPAVFGIMEWCVRTERLWLGSNLSCVTNRSFGVPGVHFKGCGAAEVQISLLQLPPAQGAASLWDSLGIPAGMGVRSFSWS